MIVPKSPRVWRMMQYVGWPLLTMAVYDLMVVVAYKVLQWHWVALPNVPPAIYGSVIGLIVGFRNNSSYGRWGEARTLLGRGGEQLPQPSAAGADGDDRDQSPEDAVRSGLAGASGSGAWCALGGSRLAPALTPGPKRG